MFQGSRARGDRKLFLQWMSLGFLCACARQKAPHLKELFHYQMFPCRNSIIFSLSGKPHRAQGVWSQVLQADSVTGKGRQWQWRIHSPDPSSWSCPWPAFLALGAGLGPSVSCFFLDNRYAAASGVALWCIEFPEWVLVSCSPELPAELTPSAGCRQMWVIPGVQGSQMCDRVQVIALPTFQVFIIVSLPSSHGCSLKRKFWVVLICHKINLRWCLSPPKGAPGSSAVLVLVLLRVWPWNMSSHISTWFKCIKESCICWLDAFSFTEMSLPKQNDTFNMGGGVEFLLQ